jgi:hypothetical protein
MRPIDTGEKVSWQITLQAQGGVAHPLDRDGQAVGFEGAPIFTSPSV